MLQYHGYKFLFFSDDRKISTCNGGENAASSVHSQSTMGLNHGFAAQNAVSELDTRLCNLFAASLGNLKHPNRRRLKPTMIR